MKRKIVRIDEQLCDGCGACIPNCAEGAIRLIDGKARLLGDLFCDGLGACLGHCPRGAISIEEREAQPYDEIRVLQEQILPAGAATLKAHLEHLAAHGEVRLLQQAKGFLEEQGIPWPLGKPAEGKGCGSPGSSCPGSAARTLSPVEAPGARTSTRGSELRHWPVQLHLINPVSEAFREQDLLLTADCVAYALGDFHARFLRRGPVAIACPKLDGGQEGYVDKIRSLVEDAHIRTLTVIRMEVPCCGGLVALARKALSGCARRVPLLEVVVSVEGQILKEEWLL